MGEKINVYYLLGRSSWEFKSMKMHGYLTKGTDTDSTVLPQCFPKGRPRITTAALASRPSLKYWVDLSFSYEYCILKHNVWNLFKYY